MQSIVETYAKAGASPVQIQINDGKTVETKLLDHAFFNLSSGLLTSLSIAALSLLILWPLHGPQALWPWLALLCLSHGWSFYQIRKYKLAGDVDPAAWRRKFVIAAGICGLAWSIVGILYFPSDSLIFQALLGLAVGTVVMASISHYAVWASSYLAFALPAILPFAFQLLTTGDSASQAIFLLLTALLLAMALTAWRMAKRLRSSYMLEHFNLDLIESLTKANVNLTNEIQARKQSEIALVDNSALLSGLAEATFEGLLVHDEGQILEINSAVSQMLKLPRENIVGRSVLDFVAPEERIRITTFIAQPPDIPYESVAIDSTGKPLHIEVRGRHIVQNNRRLRAIAVRDITFQKQIQGQLQQLANHDTVTGCASRHLFERRLNQSISRALRHRQQVGLLFIDLDNFKNINDSQGHATGDGLLKVIAKRIQSCVRDEDVVSRWGGDEFTIILEMPSDNKDPRHVAQRIVDEVKKPVEISGKQYYCTASIGCTIYPQDGDTADILLKNADAAMYRAKDRGGDTVEMFTPNISKQASQRFFVETELRKALNEKQFTLHYQPKINLMTGNMSGVEALIRWQHPEKGLIPSAEFIPIAERSGFIQELGDHVLSLACKQVSEWRKNGFMQFLPVAINLSIRQLKDNSTLNHINSLLRECSIDPHMIELEITESALAENIDAAASMLELLRASNIMLSIDDFGIGYSSFNYLMRFPINCIKIDRSFVANLESNAQSSNIIKAIIAMSRTLNLRVIAEGVETKEQLRILRQNECEMVQGFLFAKPMPAEELLTWHDNWEKNQRYKLLKK